MEFVAALIADQRGLDFSKFESGILHQRDFLFDDVKAELYVVTTVTGERIKPDVDQFHAPGFLRSSLFLNGFQNSADQMDFVHKCLSNQTM
jgi:hypothetical protein